MDSLLRHMLSILCIFIIHIYGNAQNNDAFNSSRLKIGGNTSAFNNNRSSNFNDFRQTLNAEYVNMTREKWRDFNSFRGLSIPDNDVKPVAPIEMLDDEAKRNRFDNEISMDGSVTPIYNNSQPKPIAPVQEVPETDPHTFSFSFLGTSFQVRKPQASMPQLRGIDESSIASAWEYLSSTSFNNTIVDCIKLRSAKHLCDWAYLMMLKAFADAFCGQDTNESTMLMSYIYSQSGYKIRMAQQAGRLEMLYASQHDVYGTPYFECDGDRFFAMSKLSGSLKVSSARFPKEQSLSLWVNNNPEINYSASPVRTLTSKRYPEITVQISSNKNLLSFFNSYPTSEVGGNFMTRWAMYANTQIDMNVKNELYSQLKRFISGYSQLEAVERLLNWVQTAFVYEYDDKVWGGDRAFFPDETLYYPYCDCEDRSILFTRLVRDLLNLRCILIYYPGHLAAAVCFTEQVKGDYIMANGSRFVVCDPTYIGASVGHTMPDMDNSQAKVIIL